MMGMLVKAGSLHLQAQQNIFIRPAVSCFGTGSAAKMRLSWKQRLTLRNGWLYSA